ncbi:MAG TPA: FkbM family methyltransferase [Nannocystis sp.]
MGRRYRLFGRSLRSRLIRWLVGPRAIAVLYDAENGLILLTPEDTSVLAKRLGRRGMYGRGSLDALEPHLTPSSRVLFVGAHVGTLLIPVSKRVAHVCGIEANPRTFELLRLNVHLNQVRNAELHHFAAGDAEREVEFFVNTSNSGGSKIRPRVEHYAFTYDRPEVVKVRMRRVDDVVKSGPFDVVVVDVEGAEALALAGMQRTLERCRVLHIEYIAEHLALVAGIGVDEYLAPITPHFDAAILLDGDDRRLYPRESFAEMLEGVRSTDVLFLKADAAAVAAARFGGANGRLAGGNRLLAGGNGGPGVAAARGRLKEVEAVGAYAATAQPEVLTVP